MENLSDKKCAAAVAKLIEYMCVTYDRTFSERLVTSAFWKEFEELCGKFDASIVLRPIGSLEIEAAGRKAATQFIAACKKYREQQTGNTPEKSRP